MLTPFFLCIGLVFGSLCTLLIYRLPRSLPIGITRSRCTSCQHVLGFFDLFPVLSYLLGRGKCRYCKAKIHWKYLVVELALGIVGVAFMPKDILSFWDWYYFVFYLLLSVVFVCHFVIDLEHQLLLDKLNYFLLLVLLPHSLFFFGPFHAVLGGVIGFGLPYGVSYLFYKMKGQIGLGGGDIKLYGVLGLFLGPAAVVHTLFYSCFLGSIVGITYLKVYKLDKSTPIPFGPFILIVGYIQILFPGIGGDLLRF